VLHQAQQVRPRGHERPAAVVLAQTVELRQHDRTAATEFLV
jgi:hypothetical protein